MGVFFTPHACERWHERFGSDSIKESFERAVPFGAQCGGDTYMLDGDRVFVVSGDGAVVTVLTKEMAIANMQQAGIHVDTSAFARTPVKPEPSAAINERTPIGAMLMEIISADDQKLAKLSATIDARYKNLCDYILSLRGRVASARKGSDTNWQRYVAFRDAVVPLLSGEQVQAIAESNPTLFVGVVK